MKRLPALFSASALLALAVTFAGRAAEPAAAPNRLAIPATDEGLPGAGPIRRYEWFQRLWGERRTNWAARVQQDQGALVFLGDSITQGWADNIGGFFPGVKVANRGISGDTTRGVLIRMREDVLSLNPRGVVLLIGTNDIEEQAEPETIAANLELILAELKRHNPALPVILCNVFPSAAAKKRPAAKIRALNQLYFAGLADEPQVTVLDTYALFANPLGDANPDEFPDLLHPNGTGYAKWERALRPVLETAGLVPSWPDDFTPEPGYTSLFNGRDFAGWTYADTPALGGATDTSDGRFVVRNGRLIVTPSRMLRMARRVTTERVFAGDFVLKLEFRASPNADSGIFVRGPQVQCRDYLIAGPYMNLKNYRPLQWNEIIVTVRGGLAHATCNGEVLIDAMPVPASGPIGLESDRGQMEYRRIRVRELP
jgi:lysophospholipase L1-like esterase